MSEFLIPANTLGVACLDQQPLTLIMRAEQMTSREQVSC